MCTLIDLKRIPIEIGCVYNLTKHIESSTTNNKTDTETHDESLEQFILFSSFCILGKSYANTYVYIMYLQRNMWIVADKKPAIASVSKIIEWTNKRLHKEQ